MSSPAASVRGSSPRMRGAHTVFEWGYNMLRIIPAYAGSTPCSRPRRRAAWDHPRVCGEHDTQDGGVRCQAGSSPRMRGALWNGIVAFFTPRIIPAYAGSTLPKTGKQGDY